MLLAHSTTRWCAVLLLALATACGGGGGDGGSADSGPAPSKAFVADSGQAAIGSSRNANPAPGPLVVDRIITGPNTMLTSSLQDIALDAVNDRMYVSDTRSILVFNNVSTANGNVAPSRVVSVCCGGPSGLGNFVGIYLDTVHDRLYAGVNDNLGTTKEVQVFDGVSSLSNVAPTRSFTFTTNFVMDVAVDTTKNVLYVLCLDPGGLIQMLSFNGADTLTGSVAPTRTISIGGSFSSGWAAGIFVDPANDRLYAPSNDGRVFVFDNASSKNGAISGVGATAVPERTINLPLPAMTSIFVELTADRLYAADNAGVNIIDNASTVNGTPAVTTRVLAPGGSSFRAVAVKP